MTAPAPHRTSHVTVNLALEVPASIRIDGTVSIDQLPRDITEAIADRAINALVDVVAFGDVGEFVDTFLTSVSPTRQEENR